MNGDDGFLNANLDKTIHDYIVIGKDYIALFEKSFEYEVDLYDKIQQVKDLTNSSGLVLYLVNNEQTYIKFKQDRDSTDILNEINIQIAPFGPLPGVVAYLKKDFLIEDTINFSKSNGKIILDTKILKNCIYCFPVFDSSKKVLAVIEVFRSDGGSYITIDKDYLNEFSKWFGLTIELSRSSLRQSLKNKLNEIFTNLLSNFLSDSEANLNKFVYTILKYLENVIGCENLLYYDLRKKDSGYSLYIARIYTNGETSFKLLTQRINLRKDTLNICDVIAGDKPLNIQVNDNLNISRIPKSIRDQLKIPKLRNELYIPLKSCDVTIGVISLINSKRKNIFTEVDIELTSYGGSFIVLAECYDKLIAEEQLELTYGEITNMNLKKQLLEKSRIPDIVDINIEQMPVKKLMNWQFYPQAYMPLLSYMYYMIEDVCPQYFIPETLEKCLVSAKRCHTRVPYSNFEQAFLQFHTMYLILKNSSIIELGNEEKACLLFYCAFKYVNHIGLNDETLELMKHPFTKVTPKEYINFNALQTAKDIINYTEVFMHLPEYDQKNLIKFLESHFLGSGNTNPSIFKFKLEKELAKHDFKANSLAQRNYIKNLIIFCATNSRYTQIFNYARRLCENNFKQNFFIGDIQLQLKLKTEIDDDLKRSILLQLPRYESTKMKNIIIPCFNLLTKIVPKCYQLVEYSSSLLHAYQINMTSKDKILWLVTESYDYEESEEVKGGLFRNSQGSGTNIED